MIVRQKLKTGSDSPDITPGTPQATVDEVYGCVYGGRNDFLTGTTVPYKTNYSGSPGTIPPYAGHDGGRLPGFSTGQVDWSDGATIQTWPPSLSTQPYLNAWLHCFCYSAQRGAYFEYADPAIYLYDGTTWNKQAYPNPGATNDPGYVQWISPPFNQLTSPSPSRKTTTGGTGYWSLDMSPSTPQNNYFLHAAWNYYFPRLSDTAEQLVSMQFWARMTPKAGVDPSTVFFTAGGSCDRYGSADEAVAANGINPALGIPRYKQLPTDSTWRLMGYTTMSQSALLATPPPILAAPA